jgi:putative membrane protein
VQKIRNGLLLFLKGVAMGAANVIPGVSGGTIAFITNIYEKLIDSLKSFDIHALQLLVRFRFKAFREYVNLDFLLVLFIGIGVSIISLGKLLSYLFYDYPVYVWAFFFGLILASIYFVGIKIKRWTPAVLVSFVIGTVIAVSISLFNPAQQNSDYLYLIICGIVAMSSMLLPGLSGSFVLILMGNYQLIFLEAVPSLNFEILIPVIIGSILGFIILSRLISYLLHHYHDITIGILTGFIAGSLLIIWPWKEPVYLKDHVGEFVIQKGEKVTAGYDHYLPAFSDQVTWIALGFVILGVVLVWIIESLGQNQSK